MIQVDFQKKAASMSCLFFFLFTLLVQTTPLMAWGEKGHLLVVRMAASHLTPETTAAVKELLGNESMENVVMWADRIKPERPETAPYHYINYPKTGTDEYRTVVSTESNILTAIDHYSPILNDRLRPTSERQEALKFLLHLVGDLHQPMHCATEGDVGGNSIAVWYFGKGTNLHKVWDFELIETTGLSIDEYFAGLKAEFADSPNLSGPSSNPAEWAAESHVTGLSHAYLLPADHQLAERYYEANIRTVNRQLYKAGNRLAELLNSILDQPLIRQRIPIAQGNGHMKNRMGPLDIL